VIEQLIVIRHDSGVLLSVQEIARAASAFSPDGKFKLKCLGFSREERGLLNLTSFLPGPSLYPFLIQTRREMSTSRSGQVRLLIVRHGETDCNVQGIIQGQLDTDLNPVGRKQAEYVGAALSSESIDEVYTSPLRRAKDTADAIVSAHTNLRSRSREVYWLDDRLKERGFGSLEGKTFDRSKPKRDSMDGIEQMSALYTRLESFLCDVLTKPAPFTPQENGEDSASDWKDEPITRPASFSPMVNGRLESDASTPEIHDNIVVRTIVLVSHGAAISALLGLIVDIGLATMSADVTRTRIWNCSITTVLVDTNQLAIEKGRLALHSDAKDGSRTPFIIEQWADVRHIPASIDDAVTKTGNADEMVGK
jgi:broad specificity phosphatase PhoE